jgi:hypothetical protein
MPSGRIATARRAEDGQYGQPSFGPHALHDNRRRKGEITRGAVSRPRNNPDTETKPLERLSANFLRRYRNRGNRLGLVAMYGHTSQPSSDPDDYEIGKGGDSSFIYCRAILHVRLPEGFVAGTCLFNPTELHWFASRNRSRSLDSVPSLLLACRHGQG